MQQLVEGKKLVLQLENLGLREDRLGRVAGFRENLSQARFWVDLMRAAYLRDLVSENFLLGRVPVRMLECIFVKNG